MKQPTVISTFAGCGGSSLGYKWAGFKELLATDWEENSIQTLKVNFPDTLVIKRDIKDFTGKEIMELTGLKKGELDVLDGSPLCQGFSTAGKREVSDPRNSLFQEFCRLLIELKPKVFVMENVSGIFKGKMLGNFKIIFKELEDSGYKVKAKLMNTKYYNVPQSRQRTIFIGVRNDIGGVEPTFPIPNKKILTFYEVTKDLKITETATIPGKGITKKVLNTTIEGEGGEKYNFGSLFNWQRIYRFKPCPTILKTMSLLHWKEDRYLTI